MRLQSGITWKLRVIWCRHAVITEILLTSGGKLYCTSAAELGMKAMLGYAWELYLRMKGRIAVVTVPPCFQMLSCEHGHRLLIVELIHGCLAIYCLDVFGEFNEIAMILYLLYV